MREDFWRKVPSIRDKINVFSPSMRDSRENPLWFHTFYIYLQLILDESRHKGKGVLGALF